MKNKMIYLVSIIFLAVSMAGCDEGEEQANKRIDFGGEQAPAPQTAKLPAGIVKTSPDAIYEWEAGLPQLLVRYSQSVKDIIWNDPSVMKEGSGYTMWLSGGKLTAGGKDVKIYRATSSDGISWNINPTPLVEHGPKGDFDEKGIETPSVVKVDGTYHMYYTGSNFTDSHMGRFAIGHATSKDGINWTKDPKNPVIPRTFNGLGPGEGKPNAWGWLSVSEPGVVYDSKTKTFFVYYVASKLRYDDFSGAEPKTQMAIMVATSKDGTNFKFRPDPVLVQTSSYSHNKGFYGYSTPAAMIDSQGKFHLFYDAARYVNKMQQFKQVALVHAVSGNGFDFEEKDINIVEYGKGGWMNEEVRAPYPLENENNELMLYFAGGWTQGGIGVIKGVKK